MALTKVPSNLDAAVSVTQSQSDNSTNVATTAYVDTAISNLSDSAPAALNTLNEIAAALGDNENYAATTTAAIADKLPLSGGAMTGAITTNSTFDGVDIAARDAILTSTTTTANAALPKAGGTMTGALYMPTMPTVTIDSATEYSTTETSELSPVATDALFLFNDENSSTNGKVSILMRSAGGGGAASARITLKNERSGSGGLGFFFRDNGHTAEQQEKMYLSSDGDIDTAGLLKVGVNDSEYANNYIRFKPTGAAYIDHNTVGQDINFRTSASSSLDRTPLVVQSGGILVTGSVNVSSNVIQANGNQHVIGVWGTSGLQLIGQTGADNIVGTMGANEPLAFRTGSSERARIDASGNLMVGAGSTSTRTVLTSDAVFQSYYNAESAARVHLGRDVGIGGGAGVAFGGGGGYSLIGTDNTSGTNLYFNAGSNAVGNLTTGYQLMINGSTNNLEMRGAANVRLEIGSQGTPNNNSGNWMYANGTKLRFNNAGGGYLFECLGGSGVVITAAGDVLAAGDVKSDGGATKVGGTSTVFTSSSFLLTGTAQTVVPRSAILSLPTGTYLMTIYLTAGNWYSTTVTGIVQHYGGTTNSSSTGGPNTIHLTSSGHAQNAGTLYARYQTFLGNSNNHGVQIWTSSQTTTPITIKWKRLA